MRPKRTIPTIEVVCVVCGKQIARTKYILKRSARSTCSPACASFLAHPATPTERFWANVLIAEGCWEWQGTRQPSGYGALYVKGRTTPAHRYSWELHNGPIPDGLWVLHKCDNPPCVRPDHLFLGTHQDNMDDMWAKGRARPNNFGFGEKHPMSKLTDAAVMEMRKRYAEGRVTQTALAKEFGVHQTLVSLVLRRRIWAHVP